MQISQIVQEVSRDLNDQVAGFEYMHWSYEMLLSYYKEILPELVTTAKWLFLETVIVPLVAGNVWQFACECTQILRVLGECTEDGELLHEAQETSDDNIYIWPGGGVPDRCYREYDYEAPFTSFSLNRIRPEFFKIHPPVAPIGARRYALVECYRQPDSEDESFSVPEELIKPIKQWMLYRALLVDSENNAEIRDIAKTHLQVYQSSLAYLMARNKEFEDIRNGNSVRAAQDSTPQQVPSRT